MPQPPTGPTLFITQNAPPHGGAGARRIGHLVQEFAKFGPVYVIRNSADEEAAIPGATEVFSVAVNDFRSVVGASSTVPVARKRSWWARPLLRLRQAFPFVFFTDNGGVAYRSSALQIAERLVRQKGISTIVSSFRPWSDHLVAGQLKRRYAHLHWIADFRDLPVDPVRRDVWWPALQTWWGRRVIAEADEVWCVSRGQSEQLRGWHPNVRVRYNALLSLPPAHSAPVTDRFTIVYTGSLYPDLQSVAPLVAALQSMLAERVLPAHQLLLIYRGKDGSVFREWTAGLPAACVDIQPSIAPAAAHELQKRAQILLLLTWSAPGYYGVLTAKLWDYLAAGRPVLGLVNGVGDAELVEILEGVGGGVVFGGRRFPDLRDWLFERFREWIETGSIATHPNHSELSKYLCKGWT